MKEINFFIAFLIGLPTSLFSIMVYRRLVVRVYEKWRNLSNIGRLTHGMGLATSTLLFLSNVTI
ncbi:MAG TPA: hypothetical protein VGB63_01390, partial [Pedobacter sp.]